MTGTTIGRAWAEGVSEAEIGRRLRVLLNVWSMGVASRSEYHADWYCALPGWKRWIAMVLGL